MKMNDQEKMIYAAVFAAEWLRVSATDNSGAESARDTALWAVECHREAIRADRAKERRDR